MGNADLLHKIYLVMDFSCTDVNATSLKPGPFMLDYVNFNDGSDNV